MSAARIQAVTLEPEVTPVERVSAAPLQAVNLDPQVTPVHRLERVSAALGVDVWVKREDLSHPRLGGGKGAKAGGAAEGRVRAGRDASADGRRGGQQPRAGHRGAWRSGRIRGDRGAGAASCVRVGDARRGRGGGGRAEGPPRTREPRALLHFPAREWMRLRLRGARPYFIPPGGTCAASVRGCFEAGEELGRQVEDGQLPAWPDEVVCVSGSVEYADEAEPRIAVPAAPGHRRRRRSPAPDPRR